MLPSEDAIVEKEPLNYLFEIYEGLSEEAKLELFGRIDRTTA